MPLTERQNLRVRFGHSIKSFWFRMRKAFVIAVVVSVAYVADQHYYYGYFADGLLSMLGQMRHSFGW
jgi:hypothetical protein